MLRVHFTTEDLLQVQFADEPAPMVELILAVAMLQRSDAVFGPWRRQVGRHAKCSARALSELVPATAKGPLFLDPPDSDFDDGLDRVLSTPTALVRSELRRVHTAGRPPSTWTRLLADRDRHTWQSLEHALRTAHARILGDHWDRIRAGFDAERAWRTQLLASRGIRATLTSLTPTARWRDTTLEFDSTDEVEATLDGTGVTVLPSVFWNGRPLVGRYAQGWFLVYPALTPLPLIDQPANADALAMLLGNTRAAILEHLTRPRTGSDLVRELGLAKSSVSEHTKALRAARLITAQREGKVIRHACTPLGLGLLAGVPAIGGSPPSDRPPGTR
ncbi:DUF5937 family protein [Embleya sp. NPDC008237]|uniref:ArsR/SmtB family transcription factor n=1 Tax=Embleya sp. NPDC008237 TaxID=3363978 RepID=UPI0036ED8B3D